MTTTTIEVQAFSFIGKPTLYDAATGHQLPTDWAGNCVTYFGDGRPTLYRTCINRIGERVWEAIGNNSMRWIYPPETGESRPQPRGR